jgi:hypothetical protein
MGDRYSWEEPCPKCGNTIECYYADSCEMTTARCHKCGAEFDIRLSFDLIEKHRPGGEVSRPVAESAHSGRNATPPGSTITDEQPAPPISDDERVLGVEKHSGPYNLNRPIKRKPAPGEDERALEKLKEMRDELFSRMAPYFFDKKWDGALAYLRSRLTQPQPVRVTREQIKKWFPCRCEKAWTSRGLTMPGCPYHDTLWEELLEDLGHTVEGGEGEKG